MVNGDVRICRISQSPVACHVALSVCPPVRLISRSGCKVKKYHEIPLLHFFFCCFIIFYVFCCFWFYMLQFGFPVKAKVPASLINSFFFFFFFLPESRIAHNQRINDRRPQVLALLQSLGFFTAFLDFLADQTPRPVLSGSFVGFTVFTSCLW